MRTATHTRQRITVRSARGFTLVEVLIATALLIALCIGAAMLLTLTLATIDRSRHRAMAMVLARAKLEQLLSLTWSVRTVIGVPVLSSDETTDASRSPPTAAGRGTLPSPADALAASRDGCVDYLDAQGQWVGPAGTAIAAVPAAAVYARRWSIERRGAGAAELLIVHVIVTTAASARADAAAFGRTDRDAVWITGARLRRGA